METFDWPWILVYGALLPSADTCFMEQSNCQNCHTMEKELQSKIIDVRDKELAIIELQQVCDKMEKQLVQQVCTKKLLVNSEFVE